MRRVGHAMLPVRHPPIVEVHVFAQLHILKATETILTPTHESSLCGNDLLILMIIIRMHWLKVLSFLLTIDPAIE